MHWRANKLQSDHYTPDTVACAAEIFIRLAPHREISSMRPEPLWNCQEDTHSQAEEQGKHGPAPTPEQLRELESPGSVVSPHFSCFCNCMHSAYTGWHGKHLANVHFCQHGLWQRFKCSVAHMITGRRKVWQNWFGGYYFVSHTYSHTHTQGANLQDSYG